eukprot:3600910-Amphidinium_carterae.1
MSSHRHGLRASTAAKKTTGRGGKAGRGFFEQRACKRSESYNSLLMVWSQITSITYTCNAHRLESKALTMDLIIASNIIPSLDIGEALSY